MVFLVMLAWLENGQRNMKLFADAVLPEIKQLGSTSFEGKLFEPNLYLPDTELHKHKKGAL